ncbi:MAG: hypothetical protein CMJ58_17470 [Planctomycetaceae bacterium]|nr:hypothetical protein [Planctomycetaceae bacterium]
MFWRRARAAQLRARRQLALLDLQEAGEELAETFRQAADATGLPRGLRWKSVTLGQPRLAAVERATGATVGLVAVEIRFEAIPGGGMEEVEAVSNVRAATAVFMHRNGAWTTDGRAVFNLNPQQTLERYADTLAPADEPS